MLQQITVVVKSLRHLPQQFFTEEKERELALSRHGHGHQRGHGHGHQGRGGVDFRRCLRAQASIVNETRETGNSVWGRGVRSREATWLRGSDKLCWSLPEQQFKQVKAYTPVCKVRVLQLSGVLVYRDSEEWERIRISGAESYCKHQWRVSHSSNHRTAWLTHDSQPLTLSCGCSRVPTIAAVLVNHGCSRRQQSKLAVSVSPCHAAQREQSRAEPYDGLRE